MSLSQRERVLVIGLLPLVVGAGLWSLVWAPLDARRAAVLAEIADLRRVAVAAQNAAPRAAPKETGPLAPRLATSAQSFGLELARLEPDGARLRVALTQAAFVDVMAWLAALETEQGILVTAVQFDRRPEPGIVSARLTLEDAR